MTVLRNGNAARAAARPRGASPAADARYGGCTHCRRTWRTAGTLT